MGVGDARYPGLIARGYSYSIPLGLDLDGPPSGEHEAAGFGLGDGVGEFFGGGDPESDGLLGVQA